MKKLIVSLFAMMMCFSSFKGMAQKMPTPPKKVKLVCVTTSCCGVGIFGIEIWSETTCHYVTYRTAASGKEYNASVQFSSDTKLENNKEIEIPEDVVLASQDISEDDENIEQIVLPKGKYEVENNTIYFKTIHIVVKKVCLVREVKGNFLGHDYEYYLSICIYVPTKVSTSERSSGKVVIINPNLNSEELEKILSGDKTIYFNDDIAVQQDENSYIVKAGKYFVNEDGLIYLHNVKPR